MPDRSTALLIALGAATLLPGCGGDGEGLAAFRAGQFEAARAAFERAEREGGNDAPAEASCGRAFAALRLGRLEEAEAAADRAAARGGPAFEPLRAFVRGSVAFARCDGPESRAFLPQADPTEADRALALAAAALEQWSRAAASREDWPEARRNAERAWLRLSRLRERKAAQARRREPPPLPAPPSAGDPPPGPGDAAPPPPPGRDAGGEATAAAPPAPPRVPDLTREQALALLERLAEVERVKRGARESGRERSGGGTERDW